MAIAFLLLLVPLFIFLKTGVRLKKQLGVAALRMCMQLAMLGLVLEFLFDINHWALNTGWLLVMLAAAAHSVLARTGVRLPGLWGWLLLALSVAAVSVLVFCLLLVVRPAPLHDAQYMIPLGGMILGNSMNSTTLALERFHSGLSSPDGRRRLETWLCMGASPEQARQPFLREALRAALLPTLNAVATLGLVHIPGMMTGQILGGSSPSAALLYQAMIMFAILSSAALSSILTIHFTGRICMDQHGLLRERTA